MGVFSPVGASAPSAVTISAKTTPNIRSITLGAKGVESTLTFASTIVAFTVQVAGNASFYIATSSGGTSSDTTRFNYNPGNCFHEEFLTTTAAKTFYVSASRDNVVVQIKEWI